MSSVVVVVVAMAIALTRKRTTVALAVVVVATSWTASAVLAVSVRTVAGAAGRRVVWPITPIVGGSAVERFAMLLLFLLEFLLLFLRVAM
jgi:hypothetical protein